jgi:3-phosphoshikimate 1-carboxyvinyltransferase
MTVPDVVTVHPGPLAGEVVVPGDKSLSHRALLLGSLVGTPVAVTGVAPSGDARSTAGALQVLGATVDLAPDADGNLAGTVTGPLREADDVLDCGNAGTGLRLLAGVVAGIDGLAVLTGDASLRRRPMGRVVQPLRLMGAEIDGRDGGSRPPLTIRGGRLAGITWESSIASAQVKSALLLAGLAATGPTTVVSPARSRDHTERLLRHLGVDVGSPSGVQGPEIVTVVPGPLQGDRIEVSGDPSSAAFWLVAAAIAGTEVRLPGVCVNPRRTGVIEVLRALGADVSLDNQRDVCGEPVADLVVAGGSAGTAGTAGASLAGRAEVAGELVVDAIDELPVLAVAGALSAGGLEVRDAAELRVKESDRIDGIERVGDALGMVVEARSDGFTIPGGQRLAGGGTVDADGDHRIAMAAAIGATVAASPVTIRGFASVPTSYPSFLDHLAALGGRAEVSA